MIELKNITKKYDIFSGGNPLVVLDNVSLSVSHGETIAILGPSGSGKSTLLNIAGTLDKPTSGSVLLEGLDLSRESDTSLAKIRNREIGFVFQLHHLLPQCTVFENVLIPTLPYNVKNDKEELVKRAEELLRMVGMDQRMYYYPAQLSGGERQRAAVVRALINNPKLLLADEPTGSLDSESAESIGSLLLRLNRDFGISMIVVTHSRELAQQMDSIYNLHHGKLEKV